MKNLVQNPKKCHNKLKHFIEAEGRKMKRFKNTSVFIRWFLSYLIMLGLVLLVSVGLYFFSFEIINEQGEKVNRTMLEKVQTEMDGYFTEARSVMVSLMLNENVRKAGRIKETFSIADRVLLYDIYQDVCNQKVVLEKSTHIYIYFLNTDTVLSEQGHVDSQLFYELYYQNEEMSYEAFHDLMHERWTGNVLNMPSVEGGQEMVLLRNDYPRGSQGRNITCGVSISHEELAKWMGLLNWDENTELAILNEQGVLFSSGGLAGRMLEEQQKSMAELAGASQVFISGEEHHLEVIPSSEEGVYYAALTPVAYVQAEAREIQMFMLIGLSVCITIGIVVAYILTRKNYRPLRHVMSAFGEYKRGIGSEDEYEWLQNQTIHFLEEHKEIKRRFYDNEKILHSQYVYRLITLPYEKKADAVIDFSKEISFEKPCNLVLLLYLAYEDGCQWQTEMDGGLLRFIVMNVMSELMGEKYHLEMAELMDSLACIINGDREILEEKDELDSIVNHLQEFLRERMKMHVTAVFGVPQNGLEGIYQSYMRAREASEYREYQSEQQIIWYDDVRNRRALYQYPMEAEQRIINAIKTGQEENACQWMDDIIEENYRHREITIDMRKCLLSELLGTLVKGAEQGGSIEYMKGLMAEKGIPESANENRAKEYFHEMTGLLCADIRKNEAARRENRQFGRQVMEYVHQNYQNPDLNISITALHFDITPSYLSALFKEQTGQGLLEYINNTRVERVKELLEEGKTLSEICALTGFRSSGALIRVFKKTTGVTPGQMKKMVE